MEWKLSRLLIARAASTLYNPPTYQAPLLFRRRRTWESAQPQSTGPCRWRCLALSRQEHFPVGGVLWELRGQPSDYPVSSHLSVEAQSPVSDSFHAHAEQELYRRSRQPSTASVFFPAVLTLLWCCHRTRPICWDCRSLLSEMRWHEDLLTAY